MEALKKLVERCNEMDITEQINWLFDASMPYQAQKELAALEAVAEAARTGRGLDDALDALAALKGAE